MNLKLTTPGVFAELHDDIASLRAEDASGSFGVLPGHADLLTVLDISVVNWRHHDGRERHCAVRRGLLRVRNGHTIEIATREAIVDDDLERLEITVLQEFRARDEAERNMRSESQQLEMQALREIMRYLRPPRHGITRGTE